MKGGGLQLHHNIPPPPPHPPELLTPFSCLSLATGAASVCEISDKSNVASSTSSTPFWLWQNLCHFLKMSEQITSGSQ